MNALPQPPAASFTDLQGADITVPADKIALYTVIKSDQLNVLNGMIADRTAGFQVQFSENIIATLAGLASELAHVANKLVIAITEDARDSIVKAAN